MAGSQLPTTAPTSTTTPVAPLAATRPTNSEPGLPSQHIGLDAYITRGKPRQNGKGGGRNSRQVPVDAREEEEDVVQASETVTCPVCGDFNGDELAVAHHVASHFSD